MSKPRAAKARRPQERSAPAKPKSEKQEGLKLQITRFDSLHPANAHSGRYDFAALTQALPELKAFVVKTPKGEQSVNFSDDQAVKTLNKALLTHHYGVNGWDIPAGFLCPPIPGRADYVHHIGQLLSELNRGKVPKGSRISGLDIGTGANIIYPLIAASCYQWQMTGSDIDPVSVKNAAKIASANPELAKNLSFELQKNSRHTFTGVIKPGEFYDFTMCNPPFHRSLEEAAKGTQRKLANLAKNRDKRGSNVKADKSADLNFGGQKAELWCPGGEEAFVRNMAFESEKFATQCLWFTTLLSKKENVRQLTRALNKVNAKHIRVIEMRHGQKVTRFMAWSFLNTKEQQAWAATKWR